MPSKTDREGDDDDEDSEKNERATHALDSAKQHFADLELKLEALRQQLLARGTRSDVLKQARAAVRKTVLEVAHELDTDEN